jgi:hypothetical protein
MELAGGRVSVKGSPDKGMPLAAVSVLANPVRYAFGGGTEAATQFSSKREGPPLQSGEQPGLEATGYYSPPGSTWASGCHAAYVRVDPRTYRLEILKYVVVHDCGKVINPLVVQGQIEGGVAQGIGGAFYERLAYGEDGQLRNASFMEFLIPHRNALAAEPARRQGGGGGGRDPGRRRPRVGDRGSAGSTDHRDAALAPEAVRTRPLTRADFARFDQDVRFDRRDEARLDQNAWNAER